VRARAVLVRCFGSVRDLSIIIQKSEEIVRESKGKSFEIFRQKSTLKAYFSTYTNINFICDFLGSPRAIQIAQKNIPDALTIIDRCIEEASKLENTAMESFANQTQQIFEIIGPEAAKFVNQKAEQEILLKRLYDQQEALYKELGIKQGMQLWLL